MLIFDQLRKSDPALRVLSIIVLVGFGSLVGGLWFVQVLSYKRYVRDLNTQTFRTVRVPAVRGKILDRNGIALAENRPSYNVNLYLEDLRPLFSSNYATISTQAVRQVGRKLTRSENELVGRYSRFVTASNLVQQVSYTVGEAIPFPEQVFLRHYEDRRSLPMPVKVNLSPVQVARFAETGETLPGVDLQIQSMRWYPYGSLAAHVLGHMRRSEASSSDDDTVFSYRLPDFEGVVGIESTFDDELRGKAGINTLLVNNLAYRQSETVWSPSEPGNNVVLTIDQHIQMVAEKALRGARPDVRGAVVVLDVNNGDILAMASAPTLDPNDFLDRLSPEEMQQMNDPKLRPQINRATQGAYPPGSVFKIVVGLAAMESGLLDPREVYESKGYIQLSPRSKPIKDTAAEGRYDFRRALMRSSNSYFINYGLKTGRDRIVEMGHRFFLGERIGIPTRQEDSGYFPPNGPAAKHDGEPWRDGDTANLSIGQGEITVTPLQVAVMISAVANGGRVYWPRLVSRVESPDADFTRSTTEFPAARLRGEVRLRPETLRTVHDAMLADVEDSEGTGRLSAVPGMRVCAKTGTAQVTKGSVVVDHITWFASFAPYEKPRYAVVVVVESGSSGGVTCAPVARQVYQEILRREQAPAPAPRRKLTNG